MKKNILCFMIFSCLSSAVSAQIDLNKIMNMTDLMGKILKVKKGYAPKFSLGNIPINSISKVGEIFKVKNIDRATKLFNTFKTGRTIYRVAAFAGSAISLYGTVRSLDKAVTKSNYQGAVITGVVSVATGLVTKLLTKAAAYKAVDIFNGIVRKKIQDILSVQPASNTAGIGLYVKL